MKYLGGIVVGVLAILLGSPVFAQAVTPYVVTSTNSQGQAQTQAVGNGAGNSTAMPITCVSGCSGGSGGTVAIDQTNPGTSNGTVTNTGSVTQLQSGSTTTLQDSGGTNITDATNHVLNVNVKNNGVIAGTSSTGATYAPVGHLTQTKCNAQSLTNAQLNPANLNLKGSLCSAVVPQIDSVVSGTASQTTGGTSTSLVTAVASQSLWITNYSCSNSGSSASLVSFQDGNGGSTIWTALVPNGGGNNMAGTMPLFKTTSGNALYFSPGTSSTTVYCSASGFSQ